MEYSNIFERLDIVIYIYKLLNIDEQFRLAQVNTELRNVFEKYIFPKNYDTLTVSGNHDYYVLRNEYHRNRMALQPAELQEFLHYNRKRVKEYGELNSIIFDIRPFQNLTTLCYGFMEIPRKYLLLLSELERRCPKLEKIDVDCCRDQDGRDIMLGRNWSVDSLLPMEKLKRFKVNMPHIPENWVVLSYHDFRKLVDNLKLEFLDLRCIVQPVKQVSTTPRYSSNTVQLKSLNIGFNFGPDGNISPYLDIFGNLVTLAVTIRQGRITNALLRNITEACINLKVLHIHSTYFQNIHSFFVPANVTELSLHRCYGLTAANLRQILTDLNLQKFISTETQYNGSESDFTISPTILELNFEIGYRNNFKFAFGGSEYLKCLSWNSFSYSSSVTADDIALQNCINLEELKLQTGSLSLNTLSQLKSLTKLSIPPSKLPSNWSYIIAVMKHPSLNEFSVNKYSDAHNLQKATDIPLVGFPTNIRILKITRQIFAMALDFWLDLFDKNKELQLEVNDFRKDETEFMRTVISHEKFPRYLRTLNFCCFKIKCSDLKWDLEATMKKLRKDIAHFKYDNDEYLYRIVLTRSDN